MKLLVQVLNREIPPLIDRASGMFWIDLRSYAKELLAFRNGSRETFCRFARERKPGGLDASTSSIEPGGIMDEQDHAGVVTGGLDAAGGEKRPSDRGAQT